MKDEEKPLSEKESIVLITEMINKVKNSYHDTGMSAIMWGAVIAICSLVRLSEIHFGYKLPFDIYLLTLAAIIPQIFISIKESRERKFKSYEDPFLDYLWLGFGITIFLMIHVVNLVFHEWNQAGDQLKLWKGLPPTFGFYEYVAPLMLILYGMPTFVTGGAFKFKPMLWGGILCWVCSVITVYTTIKIDLLLTAFSAVCAWFIPGIIMERDYRKAKRELKQVNV